MALTPAGLVAKTLLLAVAYYLSARLGLLLQFADTQASPVWAPSGLAFAAVLLFGAWTGGGIFLGEFLANLVDLYVKTTADPQLGQTGFLSYVITHPAHLLASAVMGFGNMLEALAGAAIVRRVVARPDVSGTIPNAFTFLLAALACCLVRATIAVS